MAKGYVQDILHRARNVQWATYANRIIIVTDTHPANVHVTSNGWIWDDVGTLGYEGIGWGEGRDPSAIVFGGYRRDIGAFVVSGFRQNFVGGTAEAAINRDVVSVDGYTWVEFGADMSPELNWSYSENTGSGRVVAGFVWRVAGSSVANNSTRWGRVDQARYLSPSYARYDGSILQRCADASVKEDDDDPMPPKPGWETVLEAVEGGAILSFGPIHVIKGGGKDDLPTLVCLVILNDPDRKFGVMSSSDGVTFTITFYGQIIQFGGADAVGLAASHFSPPPS